MVCRWHWQLSALALKYRDCDTVERRKDSAAHLSLSHRPAPSPPQVPHCLINPNAFPSRMTIGISGDPQGLNQIIMQVSKLIDVIHCFEHTSDNSVTKEMVLIKIQKINP